MFTYTDHPLESEYWRRINMRKVAHLVGAESIHNLYNRHWPRINSIRFRHTITNYKDGTVESFAPASEWQYLQHWLSKKFIQLDHVLIREIEAILSPTYDLIEELMDKIDALQEEKLSNQDLALLFIDVMDYPLGEIYRLNVVQIEYSLNHALHTLLTEYEPGKEDRNLLLSKLIAPGELTVAQEEEIHFSKIVRKARRLGVASPYERDDIKSLFIKHVETYAPKHCAYGEHPPTEASYVEKFRLAYENKSTLLTKNTALSNIQKQAEESMRILDVIGDPRLKTLCQLMAKVGVFRDKNKAKLGETVVRRLKLMDLIAIRTGEKRDNLNYYLISEIVTLLDTSKTLEPSIRTARMKDGVSFERSEDVKPGVAQIQIKDPDSLSDALLTGICASSGYVEGYVKIISSKSDSVKMKPGDIMVAIGTDFDLIEIMNMSSGIITEEGGLLSHASVVSRELKKPCLIGVEGATVTLHDGDFVKLDAIAGHLEIVK